MRIDYKPLRQTVERVGTELSVGRLPSESDFRRVWAGVFRNKNDKAKEECHSLLRRAFDEIVPLDPERLMNAVERWEIQVPRKPLLSILSDEEISPLLPFERQELVVFPNLVGGFPLGGFTVGALKQLRRDPAEVILIGRSKNGDTRFEDGELMVGKTYMREQDAERALELSSGRAALIVDDWESSSGLTSKAIGQKLHGLRFRRIYKTTGREVLDVWS